MRAVKCSNYTNSSSERKQEKDKSEFLSSTCLIQTDPECDAVNGPSIHFGYSEY